MSSENNWPTVPPHKTPPVNVSKKTGNDFIPINHKRNASEGNTDPNYGWGTTQRSSDIEIATIIPTSSRKDSEFEKKEW